MDDVIDNCQVTFEEDGINQQTLNDMRTVGFSFSFLFFTVPLMDHVFIFSHAVDRTDISCFIWCQK